MSERMFKFYKKTNFIVFCLFFSSIKTLSAYPSNFPITTVLYNKMYNSNAALEEVSIGIPIISSTWAAFKEVNDNSKIEKVESAVADKEIDAAKANSPLATVLTAAPASSFDKLSNTEQRRQYVAWFAESYIDWGFRYRYGGTSITNGIDCSAFTRFVLNYFDYKASRTAHEQFKDGVQVDVKQVRQGDLVFFGPHKEITHVAVVIKNDETGLWVVHSTCTEGIHKENISKSAYWKPKLKNIAVSIIDK